MATIIVHIASSQTIFTVDRYNLNDTFIGIGIGYTLASVFIHFGNGFQFSCFIESRNSQQTIEGYFVVLHLVHPIHPINGLNTLAGSVPYLTRSHLPRYTHQRVVLILSQMIGIRLLFRTIHTPTFRRKSIKGASVIVFRIRQVFFFNLAHCTVSVRKYQVGIIHRATVYLYLLLFEPETVGIDYIMNSSYRITVRSGAFVQINFFCRIITCFRIARLLPIHKKREKKQTKQAYCSFYLYCFHIKYLIYSLMDWLCSYIFRIFPY